MISIHAESHHRQFQIIYVNFGIITENKKIFQKSHYNKNWWKKFYGSLNIEKYMYQEDYLLHTFIYLHVRILCSITLFGGIIFKYIQFDSELVITSLGPDTAAGTMIWAEFAGNWPCAIS